MIPVEIDEEKCAGCGLCADDCPNACLCVEGGKARAREGARRIGCGHCYAICPQGAARVEGCGDAEEPAVPMTAVDSGAFLAGIKSRRSIRRFNGQPVEEEKLAAILEAGRYAPTGANAQDVAYTVLGGKRAEAQGAEAWPAGLAFRANVCYTLAHGPLR